MSMEVINKEPMGTAMYGAEIAVAPSDIPKNSLVIIGTTLYANIGDDYIAGQTQIYLWNKLPSLEVDAEPLAYLAGEKVYLNPADLNLPVNKTATGRFCGRVKEDKDLTGGSGRLRIEFDGRNI